MKVKRTHYERAWREISMVEILRAGQRIALLCAVVITLTFTVQFPKQSLSNVVCFGWYRSNMEWSLTRKGSCICLYISCDLVCRCLGLSVHLLAADSSFATKFKEQFDVYHADEDFVYNYANVARWMDRKLFSLATLSRRSNFPAGCLSVSFQFS